MNRRKPLYGVGINDADYRVAIRKTVNKVTTTEFECPYYKRWSEMLKRCYSSKYLKLKPTYKDCYVCEDWLLFSNFRKWMVRQDWVSKCLDKDLLFKENKQYSPDTCIFIPQRVNSFTTESGAIRGDCKIGVTYRYGKYYARCSNPFTGKVESLGHHPTEEMAHQFWKKRKHELACKLATYETDPRIIEALTTRYR